MLSLFPPASGFTDEARDAAAWIAAQALIALENAHLHGLVQRQAVTDELTGLANRRRFLSQMDAVLRGREEQDAADTNDKPMPQNEPSVEAIFSHMSAYMEAATP